MIKYIFSILIVVIFVSCEKETDIIKENNATANNEKWLVDTTDMTGTNVTFRFPVVTEPVYSTVNQATKNHPDERVIVFKIDETILIYPLWLMGVEVVNGTVNNTHFAATYCPKTRTSYVINREIDNKIHTFSATGVLYLDNLVYYDIETESFWSQIYFKCIHGEYYSKESTL